MRQVQYDREKFRELFVYIAEQTADMPAFGDTRLNKALHFSDFLAYNRLGHPITGARYQKLRNGPCPRAFVPIRDELESEGALSVERRPVGQVVATVTTAKRHANTALFSDDELAIVDEVVDRLRRLTARQVSDLSHRESPGWNLVNEGEDIPYLTALIPSRGPSNAAIERGRQLAAQYGW